MTPLVEPLPNPLLATDTVPAALYRRHLGLPAVGELDGRLLELADQARAWYQAHGQPWQIASQVDIKGIDGDAVLLDGGMRLRSALLADGFGRASAHALVVVAATAGEQVDRRIDELWKSDRPDEAMFLNAYAIAVVEQLRSLAAAHLRQASQFRDMTVLPHYSPGYDGWDLSDHEQLFRVIGGNGAAVPLPIKLLPSGGLHPLKSIVAAYGVTTATNLNGKLKDYWTLGSSAAVVADHPQPTYAFTEKALRLWRERRLKLAIGPNREVLATFRFDGSTCNSLGVPLAYDYRVRLEPEYGGGYRIAESACQPADGDVGHRSMCAYLDDPAEHTASVESYHPLVGQPLADALAWNPPVSPAGCLCSRASQDHKWRIVLQTLYFALENHE